MKGRGYESSDSEEDNSIRSGRKIKRITRLAKKRNDSIKSDNNIEPKYTRSKVKQGKVGIYIEERTVHNRQSKQGLNKLLEWEKGSDNDIETVPQRPVATREPAQRGGGGGNVKVLLNKQNLENLLNEKLNRSGLNAKGNYNEIFNSLNNGLEFYLKNVLERLVQINRARSVNLNLYSKFSEKDPMFKIHTFNYRPSGHVLELVPYNDFSIVFTKNMKNEIGTLEHYEELIAYKSKIEKLSTIKSKLEELNATTTAKPVTIGTTNTAANKETTTTVKPGKQPRQRRRQTAALKNYKNAVAKTQKKNEMDRQRKDTQYTLQTFLEHKPAGNSTFRTRVRL
jgi:hypothetical protein